MKAGVGRWSKSQVAGHKETNWEEGLDNFK